MQNIHQAIVYVIIITIIIIYYNNNYVYNDYIIIYNIHTGIRPVADLLFYISVNESARILWKWPSFVAIDVIFLLYQVIITDNNTIVVNDTTIDRKYEVSVDKLNICSIYTVSVTAYDETYTSDSSITQQEYTGGSNIVL